MEQKDAKLGWSFNEDDPSSSDDEMMKMRVVLSEAVLLRTMNHLFILKQLDDAVAIHETHFAACGKANIHVWSLSSGNLFAILKHRPEVHCCL